MSENITKPLDKEQIRFFLEQIKNTNYEDIPQVLKQLFRYLDSVASDSQIYREYNEQGNAVFDEAFNLEDIFLDDQTWHLPDDHEKAKIFSFYTYYLIANNEESIADLTVLKYHAINDLNYLANCLNNDLMPYFAKALQDIENDCITFDSAGLGSDTQKLWNTNIIIYGDVIGSAISAMGKAELNIEDVKNYSGLDSDELKAVLLALYKEVYSESEPQPSLWEKLKGMAPATAAMLLKYVLENSEKVPELIKNII